VLQIARFNRETVAALEDPRFGRMTLGEYSRHRAYGQDFLELYILPMGGAVWSTAPERMLQFPATTLMRFWYNHGFLGMNTRHPWWTVCEGARCYVRKMIPPFQDRIRRDSPVARVERHHKGVKIYTAQGAPESFDKIILASHADQSLRMLGDATPLERELLEPFKYQSNSTVLHTDGSIMPKTPACRASWNYLIQPLAGGKVRTTTHYWMNSLQGISNKTNYYVSLNADDMIAPEKLLRRFSYEHPLFDLSAIEAQKRLPELNRLKRDQTTYFCGSYFRYGFHEDAFGSAVSLCHDLLGKDPW
jgi:predicted NAD/FAD-binding protein